MNPVRVLASARPWRALAYLVTGCLVGVVALAGLPVLALLGGLVAAPLAALPLAALERRRVRLLGQPVPANPHLQPGRPGLAAWLRLRYTETATWRALAYAALLATVLGAVDAAVSAGVVAAGYATFVRPWLDGNWPASIGYAVLLAVALYVATAVAAGHAALARTLLGADAEQLTVRELTRSRARLVDAFEVERRRIERDLHDGAQQRLVTLTMTLGLAALELRDGPAAARELVDRAGSEARSALAEMRELVRGIHPQVLTDHGLAAAVAELADRCPMPVRVDLDLPDRLPSTVESTAYFVVAEALTNAAKHAQATSVTVDGGLTGDGQMVIEVRDDGLGGADADAGTGLAGLADRVAALDGTLRLSSPLGGPTVLRLELPCSGS